MFRKSQIYKVRGNKMNHKEISNYISNDCMIKNPFKTHALKDAESYAKNLYVTMLAMIVQYKHQPKPEQLKFLNYIIQAMELDEDLPLLLNRAQLIDSKFIEEFYLEFSNSPLVENFLVDSLILIKYSPENNETQMNLLIDVIASLDIEKCAFLKCLEIAKVLIEQDKNLFYYNLCSELDLKRLNQWESYISTSKNTIYGNSYIYKGSIENIKKMFEKQKNINYIVNECEISLDYDGLTIENQNVIIFKNCVFSNFMQSLKLSDINYLIFENCHLGNSEIRMIECSGVANIVFLNCVIENISRTKDNNPVGGFLHSSTKSNMYLIQNIFKNILIKSAQSYKATYGVVIASSLKNLYFGGNEFINCTSYAPPSYDALVFSTIMFDWQGGNDYPEERFKHGIQLEYDSFEDFLEQQLDIKLEINKIENNIIHDCTPKHIIYEEKIF